MADGSEPTRFVGIDVHRTYIVVGAVDLMQHVVLPPRRVHLSTLAIWAAQHLCATDAVVLEATGNAWQIHDQLIPLVARVTVAHPLAVKLITAARVKTDTRDTLQLARLLAANLVPAVWVPPSHVRELRALVVHRKRLVQQRTQARNRLHGVLHRHNLTPPAGNANVFTAAQRPWWFALAVSPSEHLRVRQDLLLLDSLATLITEVETELRRLSASSPWADQVPLLVQLPGIGVLSAMMLLAAIGEISRFPSAKQLVGYAGLGASVHDSGQTQRRGRITKQGRSELRAVLVEAAWVAVRTHPYWKKVFDRLASRMSSSKAIVAVARKLLVVIWHVLTERTRDRHSDGTVIARKLLRWISRCSATPGTRRRDRLQLLRQTLTHLGLNEGGTAVTYNGITYKIPPAAASP